MKIHVTFLGQDADRQAELFNQNSFQLKCAMLGIKLHKPEKATLTTETVDPEKLERIKKAVSKLKEIRKAVAEGRTDVKVGSRIGIDGFVFVV